MSTHDQCPSTVKGEKQLPSKATLAASGRAVSTVLGRPVWRSVEEAGDAPEFRDWLEREFPAGASELERSEGEGKESRRDFLKIMGASVALAGAATIPGCRRPDHKIMPYSRTVPEELVPGRPLFYATSMPRPDGGAEGLVVETHEGRPTKIEGNPLHPANAGRVSSWALSSILGLYDPDRLLGPEYQNPARGRLGPASDTPPTWDDFRAWAGPHFAGFDAAGGEGLGFIVSKAASPTRRAAAAALKARFPKAAWVDWSAADSAEMTRGLAAAVGRPVRERLSFSKAGTRVVLSLDRDFLSREPDEVRHGREFAATRDVRTTQDDMSRLYVVESGFSLTGGQADHRLRLAPSRVTAFAVELARFLLPKLSQPGAEGLTRVLDGVTVEAGADLDRRFLEEVAKDLLDPVNRGKSLVLAGPAQPAGVHALVVAINAALGNVGNSVRYVPLSDDEAADSAAQLAALTQRLAAGQIDTLVCVGANPLYDAPGGLGFQAAWTKAKSTITLSVERTETAAASTWALNGAHYLESWGDTISTDGTISPVQPMIAPLYAPAMSELEFMSLLAQKDFAAAVDGYEILRASWRKALGAAFDSSWRRALRDGVAVVGQAPASVGPKWDTLAQAISGLKAGKAPSAQSLDVAFVPGNTFDGRYANIPWLQELPEVGTRTVWDNPILMSPATAEALGVEPVGYSHADNMGTMYTRPKYPHAHMVEVKLAGRTVTGPAWILPGMADNTLLCVLGYGRTACGRVGDGVGVNVNPLRAGGELMASGATAGRAAGEHMIASTQNHWSMEGRTSIVRAVDLPAWKKFGDEVQDAVDVYYGNQKLVKKLNFAERLGELSHTPPNISIYANPFNQSKADPARNSAYSKGPQWGMTIDQTRCTGCGACTIACQAENNIPVVGKKEVAKGREMTWIRVDRYFTGDMNSPDAMLHQPVACVHCENAPCETVCPVNATVHGPEGINYMTYNRCIGTRYCANNCPYKVRRFNFFDYGVTKFNGDYLGQSVIDGLGKSIPGQEGITGSGAYNSINPNLIPPRLRQKLDQISRMQKNPDVTVRSRGVMEKCSYCIQRINTARIEVKLQNLPGIPDGFFQTACQQACPSEAIVFGDILDEKSQVRALRGHARSYELLGYLNTRPRTTHLVRVMNPNPALCDDARKAAWEHPFHGGGHGSGHGHEGGHESGGGHQAPAPAKGEGHSFLRRKSDDGRGYALSLRVLGSKA